MSKRGDAGAGLGALLGLLLGGGRYYQERKDRSKREEEDERLRLEEQARYEAEQKAADARYRGQQERKMLEEGYARRETPALTGSPGSMAGFASAVQGSTSFADMPNQYWDRPPEPETFTIPGTDIELPVGSSTYNQYGLAQAKMPGGSLYAPEEPTPYQRWLMEQENVPTPLTDLQRMGKLTEGWTPEKNITTYDLQTQQPMVGGQPRPAVAGLVAPPVPEPPVDPNPITFSGAQVVSLAAKAADPFMGGPAIYDELGNAMSALSGLSGAGGGTTGAVSLVDILKDYPDITLTTADLNVLEQILQQQGITAVRQAIETELR